MESHQKIFLRIFKAMSSGEPFSQHWECDIRRLGNVDVSNGEGRTLLQHAVIQGMLDWVQALVGLGADLSGDSGQSALKLAREKSEQHPDDAHRLTIKAVLEVFELQQKRERQGGGVRSEERFPLVPHILNLQWLEDLLGVKLETCGERVKLPADVLQHLKETADQDGNSLLMRAAKEGNFECVDLLLRCGAQVNASRTIAGEEQRAIDFADEGDYKSIVKLLLQWDSLIPHENDPEDWLMTMAREDQDIEDLLKRRDDFHKKVREGDEDGITEMVSSGEGKDNPCGHPRYRVNREGRSALLTATFYGKPSVMALLKRLNFECLEREKCQMEGELEGDRNKRREVNSMLVNNVEPVKDRHVLMMMLQSFMRKGEVEPDGGDFIRQIYEAADKVPEARVLMQYLQYEPDLEVIFDEKRNDISCMYLPSGPGVPGAYDSSVHRVYASAALDPWSDTVSNLVHELAHTVLHVVFENDGLPYFKGDQERKETYNKIVSNILSHENINNCNIVIQKVRDCYKEKYYPHELIVRVPEIFTKLKVEGYNGESREPWRNDHEKKLFNFYHECIEKHILHKTEAKSEANLFDFISRHVREAIGVGSIENTRPIHHNNIHYLQVSNLALGVSHVKKSLKGILCVDWAKYSRKSKSLKINLIRRNISHMAVVWDEGMGKKFCEESENCSKDCPAFEFSGIKEYVTFVVPKSFTIPGGNDPLEYKWEHLSTETKEWILRRKVSFQGKEFTMKEMIDFVTKGSEIESIMSSITDSDAIARLIDEEKMLTFGCELKSLWEMRGKHFTRNHPEICFKRTMKVREIDLKEAISRGRDAFFFINAKESDIREMNVGEVSYWNSENVPDGANCFLLKKNMHPLSEKILCGFICTEILFSGKWPYAHFLRYSEGIFIHVLSECVSGNCGNVGRLLADEPGSGKTVFAYDTARKEKENHPEIWTEVVELSKCEKVLELWNENNSEGNGSVEDFLYNLITEDLTESQPGNMVRKLFQHFCQTKNKASLYFDGFDEICPKYKNKFSSFLKNLLKESKVNVLVTSRTNESQHLEDILSTFAIHFVPFDRKEQINYLNKVWNALLKLLEGPKRVDKLNSVISNLRARHDSENKFGKVIEYLERYSQEPSAEVDFIEVAEEVIFMSQSSVKGERYLSGVPLHAWMIASVYFEDNFHLPQSLELSNFYTRFVAAKLKEYCSEKVKLTECQVGEAVLRSTTVLMYQNLKKFSASFLLRDPKYQPKKEYLSDLVRAGLLLEKSGSFDFIHRTFAELFFSVWMLEEAQNSDVTRILLERVLLDIEFENVRGLINEILLSSDKNTSANGGECICEITEPKILACEEDEELSILFRKSFHRALSSCHWGIINYLAKSSKEKLTNALFSMGVCKCGVATRYHLGQKDRHNSFCLKYLYQIKLRDLETVHTLLTLTEENGLFDKLRDFMSECELEWAGINSKKLWEDKESRAWLLRIIDFFSKHIHILREAIGDKILRKNYLVFLKYLSLFSFNEWKYFLNSIVGMNCFRELLVPSSGDDCSAIYSPMTDIWCFIVTEGSMENISEMWDLIKNNLMTRKEKKAFLLRKDEDGRNCLFLSIFFTYKFQNVMYVWKQFESEFEREELKELIFKSFESSKCYYFLLGYRSSKNMTDWLNHIAAENVISWYNSVVLFRKILEQRFTTGGWFPVQEFLMAAGMDERAKEEVKEILTEEKIWGSLILQDFNRPPEFLSVVQREWDRILPSLSPHLPTPPIPLDEYGRIWEQNGLTCVHMITMVSYLLFSWRQFDLISKCLTSRDLVKSALKNYFSEIFGTLTKCLGPASIPLVFSVPTAFFSKELFCEAFLESNFLQNIADLETEDIKYVLQFLAAYDVSRLFLGEDALCVVHSITIGRRNESLVDVLLKEQEEGIFERYFSDMEYFLREYPPSQSVHLQSYNPYE